MRLSKTAKRVLAYAGIWGGLGLGIALCATYPKVIAAIIMISCGVMLLVVTWQLVASYINE